MEIHVKAMFGKIKFPYSQSITFYVILLLLPLDVFSQTSETIRSDRPGQAFSQYTVGDQVLQFQVGVGYWNSVISTTDAESLYETLFIQYGITENIDINATVAHQSLNTNIDGFETKRNGISGSGIGFRIHLFERTNFTASWQTMAVFYSLISDELVTGDGLGYSSAVSLGYSIGSSGLSVVVGTSDGTPFNYVVNYSIPIGDNFSTFLEVYGTYDDEFYNAFDAGFAYVINKDFQLDIYGGIDLDEGQDSYFIEAGITYRILGLK